MRRTKKKQRRELKVSQQRKSQQMNLQKHLLKKSKILNQKSLF
jgi:hypothetical protein